MKGGRVVENKKDQSCFCDSVRCFLDRVSHQDATHRSLTCVITWGGGIVSLYCKHLDLSLSHIKVHFSIYLWSVTFIIFQLECLRYFTCQTRLFTPLSWIPLQLCQHQTRVLPYATATSRHGNRRASLFVTYPFCY